MALDMKYFEEMEAKIPKGKVRTRFAPSRLFFCLFGAVFY